MNMGEKASYGELMTTFDSENPECYLFVFLLPNLFLMIKDSKLLTLTTNVSELLTLVMFKIMFDHHDCFESGSCQDSDPPGGLFCSGRTRPSDGSH